MTHVLSAFGYFYPHPLRTSYVHVPQPDIGDLGGREECGRKKDALMKLLIKEKIASTEHRQNCAMTGRRDWWDFDICMFLKFIVQN